MKKLSLSASILFLTFSLQVFAQLDMQKLIGKSQSEVIRILGNPVHLDNSNPSMIMMFYKSDNSNKSIVADENGVYQAEATQSFDSEKSGLAALNGYISDMVKNGFAVDTVSVSEFNGAKTGVSCSYTFGLNSFSNRYEIKVTANRKD